MRLEAQKCTPVKDFAPKTYDILTNFTTVGRDKSRPWNRNARRPNSLLRDILRVVRLCTMLLRSYKLQLQAGLAAYCCLETPVRINSTFSMISWPPADKEQKIHSRSRIFLHQKCTQHAMLGMISAKMVSWSVPPIWPMRWMSRTLPNSLQMRHRYKYNLDRERYWSIEMEWKFLWRVLRALYRFLVFLLVVRV